MSKRFVVAIAFAIVLVLAGCSGGGPTGTDSPETGAQTTQPTTSTDQQTTTESTTTATPTSSETPTPTESSVPLSEVTYPPGTSAEGVTNASAAIAAHNEALVGLDFEGRFNGTTIEVAPNRSGRYTENLTFQVDRGGPRYSVSLVEFSNRQSEPLRREATGYSNGTHSISRQTHDGETEYRVEEIDSPDQRIQFDSNLREVFRAGTFAPVSAVQRGDRTLIRYELTAVNQSQIVGNATVDVAEGVVVVDDRGIVHEASYRVRVIAEDDGTTGTLERRVTFSLSTGDVTVERPAWVDTAISQNEAS